MGARRRPAVVLALAATVALVALAAGACSSSDDASTTPPGVVEHGVLLKPTAKRMPVPNPDRWTGPQGQIGQFVVSCRYSHSAPDDPIVHFGHPGRSHRHDFYGAKATRAGSTAQSLIDTATTCNKTPDSAAYWQPTLYDHDQVVVPGSISAYYRAAPGVRPAAIRTMPTGLSLITGDMTATSAQPGDATGWTCGSSTDITDDVPECTPTAPLHLVLTFPDCWDGVYLDSVDHHSHAAYSKGGRCPAGFGVHIPQITMSVKFPIWGSGHDLSLASGNMYSAHGDFYNAWNPKALRREIDHCIHRNAVCDLASNRSDDPLFQANP